jgi:hypothetical protein
LLASVQYLAKQLLDLHVVDDAAVAPGAFPESPLAVPHTLLAHAAREETGSVGQELHLLKVTRVERVGAADFFLLETLVQAPLYQ